MIKEVPGTHCEICLTPPQPGFFQRSCRRFHGVEYVCPPCRASVDAQFGPKLMNYLLENDGCLFEELRFAEERLNKTFVVGGQNG